MGVVLGADSLATVTNGRGEVTSILPNYSKLFSIDPFPPGVLLNGDGEIADRTVEDIVEEFSEIYPKSHNPENYNLRKLTQDFGNKVQNVIREARKGSPVIEILIGGYSKGREGGLSRYGEIYSLRWDSSQSDDFTFHTIFNQDYEFGTYYEI